MSTCAALFFSLAVTLLLSTSNTYPDTGAYCHRLSSVAELGPSIPSDRGVVVDAFENAGVFPNQPRPSIATNGFTIVCLAQGPTRGKFATMSVLLNIIGLAPHGVRVQVEFYCSSAGEWAAGNSVTFNPTAPQDRYNPRRNCSLCIHGDLTDLNVDPDLHCVGESCSY